MQRREFASSLVLVAMAAAYGKSLAVAPGPPFWLASRARAQVFIFGFADAKDDSWLTPPIRQAMLHSSELWLEVGPGRANEKLLNGIGLASGRTFFEALDPEVRERTLAYVSQLGISRAAIERQRPWRAFYTINSAFWSQHKLPYEEVYADQVLREMAQSEHKTIGYEMPTGEVFARFMAAMPDKAQSQYIEWLLDFLDEQSHGPDAAQFSWIQGKPVASQRSLDRMRSKMPDLYRVIQVQRNVWWAKKIDELLSADGTYFVAVGMLHVLGPDGIPRQLQRLRVVSHSGLEESPSLARLHY